MDPGAREYFTNFFQNYYAQYMVSPLNVLQFFSDDASLNYEGQEFIGKQKIMEKYQMLPQTPLEMTSLDLQMVNESTVMAVVLGQMKTDDTHVIGFTETFIVQSFNGTPMITKGNFRLTLHNIAA